MCPMPHGTIIKNEDQILCCRQCIAGYALSRFIHRIHSEINLFKSLSHILYGWVRLIVSLRLISWTCAANEGPVKIQYKCLVPIYIFPEMKLLFPKHNYNVLSPSSYTHKSVRDLYISRIGLPILLQENMWIDPGIYKLLRDT
jgi:hypothetical protein